MRGKRVIALCVAMALSRVAVAGACDSDAATGTNATFPNHAIVANSSLINEKGKYLIRIELTNCTTHDLAIRKNSLPWVGVGNLLWYAYYLQGKKPIDAPIKFIGAAPDSMDLGKAQTIAGTIPMASLVGQSQFREIDANISRDGIVLFWSSTVRGVDDKQYVVGDWLVVAPKGD